MQKSDKKIFNTNSKLKTLKTPKKVFDRIRSSYSRCGRTLTFQKIWNLEKIWKNLKFKKFF